MQLSRGEKAASICWSTNSNPADLYRPRMAETIACCWVAGNRRAQPARLHRPPASRRGLPKPGTNHRLPIRFVQKRFSRDWWPDEFLLTLSRDRSRGICFRPAGPKIRVRYSGESMTSKCSQCMQIFSHRLPVSASPGFSFRSAQFGEQFWQRSRMQTRF